MQARLFFATLATAVLAATAVSQTAIWTPNGYAATVGNSNNIYPWGRAASAMHYMQIYGAANFTGQSVNFPVLISRLRFRTWAVATTTTWAGGSWPNVVLNMSTSVNPYTAANSTFAANHGGDLTNVYTGTVTVLPGAGNGTGVPGPVYIDIPLTTPFLYNPTTGDLCFEVQLPGVGWAGVSQPCDAVSGTGTGGPAQMTRIYELTSATSAVGTVGLNYGLATEFDYVPASGYAYSSTYGAGCYNRPGSFYESFATAAAFDLNNNSLTMIYNGSNGYIVLPGITSFVVPSGLATTVANGDDVEQVVTLGSSLSYPCGSTSQLAICSNGFISAATGNGTGFTPSSAGFLGYSQTSWAPAWHDFNPSIVGSGPIQFEEIGSVSYVTWNGVWDFGGTSAANASTMQVQFNRANGNVSMIWQTMSTLGNGMLTGFKAGGPVTDPGNRDISATLAATFVCGTDIRALALAPSARPRLNTTINLVTTNVPSISGVGATILSFTQHNPGLDLTSIGMPGCSQFVGLDTSSLFFPAGGTGSTPFVLPNNPVYAGMHVYAQSAAFAAGVNPLGVLSSNGVTLVIDVN